MWISSPLLASSMNSSGRFVELYALRLISVVRHTREIERGDYDRADEEQAILMPSGRSRTLATVV